MKCAGSLKCQEVVTMTMSKEWIFLHGIFHLLRRSESVRSIAIARTAIVEYIYGLKDKEFTKIQRQFSVLCRNTTCFP